MPLYLIETIDKSIQMVVRAVCATCARSVAVQAAREEGTAIWRDPEQSTVREIKPDGPVRGVVLRSETK